MEKFRITITGMWNGEESVGDGLGEMCKDTEEAVCAYPVVNLDVRAEDESCIAENLLATARPYLDQIKSLEAEFKALRERYDSTVSAHAAAKEELLDLAGLVKGLKTAIKVMSHYEV